MKHEAKVSLASDAWGMHDFFPGRPCINTRKHLEPETHRHHLGENSSFCHSMLSILLVRMDAMTSMTLTAILWLETGKLQPRCSGGIRSTHDESRHFERVHRFLFPVSPIIQAFVQGALQCKVRPLTSKKPQPILSFLCKHYYGNSSMCHDSLLLLQQLQHQLQATLMLRMHE